MKRRNIECLPNKTEIENFRSIMSESKNEELEESERKRRASNVILHGVRDN